MSIRQAPRVRGLAEAGESPTSPHRPKHLFSLPPSTSPLIKVSPAREYYGSLGNASGDNTVLEITG